MGIIKKIINPLTSIHYSFIHYSLLIVFSIQFTSNPIVQANTDSLSSIIKSPKWSPEVTILSPEEDNSLLKQLISSSIESPLTSHQREIFKNYFKKRIDILAQKKPIDVLRNYYLYPDLFPEDSLILVFSPVLTKLSKSRTNFQIESIEVQNLFLNYISALITQANSEVSTFYFYELIELINFYSEESTSHLQQKAIILLLKLFDLQEPQVKNISLTEWDELLVLRHQVFETLRSKFKTADALQLFYNSLLASTENSYENSLSLIYPLILANSLKANLFYFQRGLTQLKSDSKEISKLFLIGKALPQSSLSIKNTHESYQILFSSIEILKTIISLKTSLNFNTKPIIEKTEESESYNMYLKLNSLIDDALGFIQLAQYKISLIDQCYVQNTHTPTCVKYREKAPFQEVKNNDGSKNSNWILSDTKKIFLPAGKYEFLNQATVTLQAPVIEFHPLALVKVPSGQIIVNTQNLISPWLDVSGLEFTDILPLLSPGSRPWIKTSELCGNKEYLTGASPVRIPQKNCTEDCKPKVEWSLFTFKNKYSKFITCHSHAMDSNKNKVGSIEQMLGLGTPPEELINYTNHPQFNGSSSGDIYLNVSSQILFPYLFLMGSDGAMGLDGQSSPQCKDGVFESFKIALSHYKEDFNKWKLTLSQNKNLNLIEEQTEAEHSTGLFEISLPRTSGSDGGSGGTGGSLYWNAPQWKFKSYFIGGGNFGTGGLAGACGPNLTTNGKSGLHGADGKFFLGKFNLSRK